MTLTRHENGAGATPTFGRRRRRQRTALYHRCTQDLTVDRVQIDASRNFSGGLGRKSLPVEPGACKWDTEAEAKC